MRISDWSSDVCSSDLFDVFHDAADKDGFAIGQAIDVDFGGVVQEAVEQHGPVIADLDRLAHVAYEVLLFVNAFHCAPAQHIAWTPHQRVADLAGITPGIPHGRSETRRVGTTEL